jgi:hypothetical protein
MPVASASTIQARSTTAAPVVTQAPATFQAGPVPAASVVPQAVTDGSTSKANGRTARRLIPSADVGLGRPARIAQSASIEALDAALEHYSEGWTVGRKKH